jgi:hypothetical protein
MAWRDGAGRDADRRSVHRKLLAGSRSLAIVSTIATQVGSGQVGLQQRLGRRAQGTVLGAAAIIVSATFVWMVSELTFSANQLYVVRPVLVIIAIFCLVAWTLARRRGLPLLGEVGLVYLAIALAYAIVPALRFIALDVRIPPGYDALNFAILSPTPQEIGVHYWRHVLFFAGVAIGFLAVRLQPLHMPPERHRPAAATLKCHYTIMALAAVIVGCAALEALLSAPVNTYWDFYIRFDHLPWGLRHLVMMSVILRTGTYFVLLGLMFSDYRRYRFMIFATALLLCAYEMWYSFGSRIAAATIFLAVFAFYNLRVRRVRLLTGAIVVSALGLGFAVAGIVRSFNNDIDVAKRSLIEDSAARGDEFDAIFGTSFHIYHERERGTLPPRDWRMFAYDLIALVPFVDHIENNPQYWYARHYFPEAPVPPTTVGVIAESGFWGGEPDLFVRSMLSGALFALLTRWFLRRRHKWWALITYVYCYAASVMTLKYSVLYLAAPLERILLPAVLVAAALLWWENHPGRLRRPRTRRRFLVAHAVPSLDASGANSD